VKEDNGTQSKSSVVDPNKAIKPLINLDRKDFKQIRLNEDSQKNLLDPNCLNVPLEGRAKGKVEAFNLDVSQDE
jgi:hypothetical protein